MALSATDVRKISLVDHGAQILTLYIDLLVFLTEEFGLSSTKHLTKSLTHLNSKVERPLLHKVDKHLLGHEEIRELARNLFNEVEDVSTLLPDVHLPTLYGTPFVRSADRVRCKKYFVPVHEIPLAVMSQVDENLSYKAPPEEPFDR